MIQTWELKNSTIKVIKAEIDNIEELKSFLVGKNDTIELLSHKTNKYYKTLKEKENYYVITELGMFKSLLIYLHLNIGEYLVKDGDKLKKYSKEELEQNYKLIKT